MPGKTDNTYDVANDILKFVSVNGYKEKHEQKGNKKLKPLLKLPLMAMAAPPPPRTTTATTTTTTTTTVIPLLLRNQLLQQLDLSLSLKLQLNLLHKLVD